MTDLSEYVQRFNELLNKHGLKPIEQLDNLTQDQWFELKSFFDSKGYIAESYICRMMAIEKKYD